jgi:hypothetical protein
MHTPIPNPISNPNHLTINQLESISPLLTDHCSLLTQKKSPLPQFFLAAPPISLFPVLETCESTDAKRLAPVPLTKHPGASPTYKYLD